MANCSLSDRAPPLIRYKVELDQHTCTNGVGGPRAAAPARPWIRHDRAQHGVGGDAVQRTGD